MDSNDPPGPPIQPSSKSSAAAPMVNSGMELGNFAGQAPAPQVAENDIMQIARIGDVPAMEKLFESGTFDATFIDDEGITPLHVRPAPLSSPSPSPAHRPRCLVRQDAH